MTASPQTIFANQPKEEKFAKIIYNNTFTFSQVNPARIGGLHNISQEKNDKGFFEIK